MTSNFAKYRLLIIILGCLLYTSVGFSQGRTSTWKLQFAIGVNNPIDDNDQDDYYTKYVNFPSINLGIQRMFTASLGAKLDAGYNRASNAEASLDFKFNYSRVNLQLVYDAYSLLSFLPQEMNIVGHIGPGVSFTRPLGEFANNKYTYLNALAGLELHYALSRSLSVYGDVSYVISFSGKEKYDTAVDGFSFNGDLMYVSLGLSVSLSGCYYCD